MVRSKRGNEVMKLLYDRTYWRTNERLSIDDDELAYQKFVGEALIEYEPLTYIHWSDEDDTKGQLLTTTSIWGVGGDTMVVEAELMTWLEHEMITSVFLDHEGALRAIDVLLAGLTRLRADMTSTRATLRNILGSAPIDPTAS